MELSCQKSSSVKVPNALRECTVKSINSRWIWEKIKKRSSPAGN